MKGKKKQRQIKKEKRGDIGQTRSFGNRAGSC